MDETTLPVGSVVEKHIAGVGKVVQNLPNFDFFNYAGLHRPVKIYTTPATYIQDVTIVTKLDGRVDYAIKIDGSAAVKVKVKVKVLDESGAVVAESAGHQVWHTFQTSGCGSR